jgi:hypothetical protein
MQKFVKKKLLTSDNTTENAKTLKAVVNLTKVDTTKPENRRSSKKIDVGTRAMTYIVQNKLCETDALNFKKTCSNVYSVLVSNLQKSLPFDSFILKDATMLHPENRHDPNSLSSISRLSLTISETLTPALNSLFPLSGERSGVSTKEDICDEIRNEWRLYQLDTNLPSFSYSESESTTGTGRQQDSYWRRVHEEHDLTFITREESPSQRRIDEYWEEVSRITDEFGKLKYKYLSTLAKCVLSLSHGNAVPESGFSLNKSIMDVHGCSLDNKTLVSLRTIKDACIREGGFLNIKITNSLIQSVKGAYQKYNAALEEKKKLEEAIAKREKEELGMKRKREGEALVEEISRKKVAIEVTEEQIQDANTELQEILKCKTLSRSKLLKVNTRLNLAIQQKKTLSKELEDLEKK